MQLGDTVNLKVSVDPKERTPLGYIDKFDGAKAFVVRDAPNYYCEWHYIVNLEPYQRPFAVGDKVSFDNGYLEGTIVYISGNQHVLSTNSKGLYIRRARSLKHK